MRDHGSDVGLVKRPQRLGILPTLSFWSEENLGKIRLLVVPPIVIAATAWFLFTARISWLPGPLRVLLAGLGGGAIAYLTIGISERLLRLAVALRRRRLQLEAKNEKSPPSLDA